MVTGDAAYIKKINRSLIIEKIVEQGMISRADLSKMIELTRATISAQVSDLLDEELIVETQQEHNSVGRRPIMLSLNRKAGYALGIDLDYQHIRFTLSDLLGYPVYSETVQLETSDYDVILHLLIEHIQAYKNKYSESRYGIVGIVIGIHGIVNKDETIYFVPRHQWHNKNLRADLEAKIDINIYIENNANLCSFAEKVYNHHHSDNLLCVSMYSGVGLGIMNEGELLKGYHGYAGEMGHMIIVPDGKPCNCGNHGCWELYSSEASFFKELAEKHHKHDITYTDIRNWMIEQDPIICKQLEQFIKYLSIGLNNIINLYNPEILVLNSELLKLYPNAEDIIKSHLTSTISHYRELVISDLGKQACVMGACALAIKNFLDIPALRLNIEDDYLNLNRENDGTKATL